MASEQARDEQTRNLHLAKEDLGRLFEVGFDVGILAYIRANRGRFAWAGDGRYAADLSRLKLRPVCQAILDRAGITSVEDRVLAERWLVYSLQRGYLSGLSFFGEYVASLEAENPALARRPIEIAYLQCSFSDDNGFGFRDKGDEAHFADLLAQLPRVQLTPAERVRYSSRGGFLRADTLLLLRSGSQTRVLVVDLSVFADSPLVNLGNLDDVETARRMLVSDVAYLRSKSVFANLCIETGTQNLGLAEGFQRYFTAFKYRDKEATKLVQAGAYAFSFREFALDHGLLAADDNTIFNVVGYSNRGLNAMAVGPANLGLLETCYHTYREGVDAGLEVVREDVWGVIARNAIAAFQNGRRFVNDLLARPDDPREPRVVEHIEQVSGFASPVDKVPEDVAQALGIDGAIDLRDAHARLVTEAVSGESTYVFLTGNPGIGKTTAIVEFLKAHEAEGYLFIYASPRKVLGSDLLDKVRDPTTGRLYSDNALLLNTNSLVIRRHGGEPTVQHWRNGETGDVVRGGVHFVEGQADEDADGRRQRRLKAILDDTLEDRGEIASGVLRSLSQALRAVIDGGIATNVLATITIQALRKTRSGDTLAHLEEIFASAYNKRDGEVLPDTMRQIASRFKHVFIMVDEVTGDPSGAEFLAGVHRFVQKYGLTNPAYGFNTKIIVADASIVDRAVIEQHLTSSSVEPNKVFFRKLDRGTGRGEALSRETFYYRRLPAVVVNANSYPAHQLELRYRVFLMPSEREGADVLHSGERPPDAVQSALVKDIVARISQPDAPQIIVYVQNKQRLAQLIEVLRAMTPDGFVENRDYVSIHADMSDRSREELHKYKDKVRVVFMTASASRGLSFPRARSILVDVPRFSVEQNLMEIIQVIYRARGRYLENGASATLDDSDKELVFYVTERVALDAGSSADPWREASLGALNLLLILKAAVMTRIVGSGRIGRDDFVLVPIGGKSVSAAGEPFSTTMGSLKRGLDRYYLRHLDQPHLRRAAESLKTLLARCDVLLTPSRKSRDTRREEASFLEVQKRWTQEFAADAGRGIDRLLDRGDFETSHVAGGLLIVPVGDRNVESTYRMRVGQELRERGDLLRDLLAIRKRDDCPESLRESIRAALDLLDLLPEDGAQSQYLEQHTARPDQYYAIPLLALCAPEAFASHFAAEDAEKVDCPFRDVLASYARSLYPITDVLPLGSGYESFPFVLFTSHTLAEFRRKPFSAEHILTSHEFNVLNLILARTPVR